MAGRWMRRFSTSMPSSRQEAGRRPGQFLTLKAGYHYGETTELFAQQYQVPKAKLPAGTYRKITGNEATAMGMIAAVAPGRESSSSIAAIRSRPPATSCMACRRRRTST